MAENGDSVEWLRANQTHPTYKKMERIIGLLEHCQINFEWVNGKLKIRDSEYAVSFDVVEEEEGNPLTEVPPLYAYKLVRGKSPNKYCECIHCNPDFGKDNNDMG